MLEANLTKLLGRIDLENGDVFSLADAGVPVWSNLALLVKDGGFVDDNAHSENKNNSIECHAKTINYEQLLLVNSVACGAMPFQSLDMLQKDLVDSLEIVEEKEECVKQQMRVSLSTAQLAELENKNAGNIDSQDPNSRAPTSVTQRVGAWLKSVLDHDEQILQV